jgi:hypothetical protein
MPGTQKNLQPVFDYDEDGASTHCFRAANSHDDPPENHNGGWQYPTLVGWDGYPAGLRDKLVAADFGSTTFGIKDGPEPASPPTHRPGLAWRAWSTSVTSPVPRCGPECRPFM